MMTTSTTSQLALLGGKALYQELLKPTSWPPIYDKTAERLVEIYRSRKWSFNGPVEQAFSQAFADYHTAKHGIFMANGTVTLETALQACGVGAGDEVIVPALTWMATAMAAHYVGATPIFVDIEPTTLCLDPKQVKLAITEKTKAIIPVHLFGSMADMDSIMAIAKEHQLYVIEDCAHMHGGKWDNQGAGSIGHIGSFSFQESKTVSSGEGGICLTNDDELAEKIYRIKHIGYAGNTAQGAAASGPPKGLVCHNYRATEFQAAILAEQLEHLPARIEKYNKTRDQIQAHINENKLGIRIQSRGKKATTQGFYSLCLIFDQGPLADVPCGNIRKALHAEGLSMGFTYGPVYKHILYNMPKDSFSIFNDSCPVAEKIGTKRTLMLLHNWLSAEPSVVQGMCEILSKVVANADALRDAKID